MREMMYPKVEVLFSSQDPSADNKVCNLKCNGMAKFITLTIINKTKKHIPAIVNVDDIHIILDYLDDDIGTTLWYKDGSHVQIKETMEEMTVKLMN